jgi:quercetin dioxygenase-like cupin family protein
MKKTRIIAIAVLIVGGGLALHVARAQQPGMKRTDGATAPIRETVTLVADKPIPNLPGKRLVSQIVDYPPGGKSIPHHHPSTAFIYAYVISGAIRSAADDEPVRVYRSGETWFEYPGAYHWVSENASATEPARLLAVLIADTADPRLVIPDPQIPDPR